MSRQFYFILFSSICALIATASARAEEPYWNQFRGPHADGASATARPPIEFDDEKNVLWKTPIHGKGWSSPVVWEQQIWLTTAPVDGTELFAVCVNLNSGQIEHDLRVFEVADPNFCHPTNSYASCTPVVEAGRVYVHFGSYGTACLDTRTGKKLWERRDLECDHFRGPGSSPILHGDLLIIQFDGVDVQYVVALGCLLGDRPVGLVVAAERFDQTHRHRTVFIAIEFNVALEIVSQFGRLAVEVSIDVGDDSEKHLWK